MLGNPAVGEEDEVSIKQVADAIVKAVGFTGEYSVRFSLVAVPAQCKAHAGISSTPPAQMVSTRRRAATASFASTSPSSSSLPSRRVRSLSLLSAPRPLCSSRPPRCSSQPFRRLVRGELRLGPNRDQGLGWGSFSVVLCATRASSHPLYRPLLGLWLCSRAPGVTSHVQPNSLIHVPPAPRNASPTEVTTKGEAQARNRRRVRGYGGKDLLMGERGRGKGRCIQAVSYYGGQAQAGRKIEGDVWRGLGSFGKGRVYKEGPKKGGDVQILCGSHDGRLGRDGFCSEERTRQQVEQAERSDKDDAPSSTTFWTGVSSPACDPVLTVVGAVPSSSSSEE